MLIAIYCALQVFGWEQWALPVPDSSLFSPDSLGSPPPNIVCRFSLGVLVYMAVYILQVSWTIPYPQDKKYKMLSVNVTLLLCLLLFFSGFL